MISIKRMLAFLSIAAPLCLGCNSQRGAKETPTPAPAPVVIVKPERQSLRRIIEQPGAIQPDEQTELVAKLPAYVAKLHADIGKVVRGPKYDSQGHEIEPGELLAKLTIPELEEELNQKKAKARYAEAQVKQAEKAKIAAEANVGTARATLDEAKAMKERWESESERMAAMTKTGSVEVQTREETKRQYKASIARVASADAGVLKAEADAGKADADLLAAREQVHLSKAEVGQIEALLTYTKIRAPYDGIVVRRHVNTGDFLRGEAGKGGAGIFTVARTNPVRVVVAVPEADAGLIEEKAEATLDVLGRSLKGQVSRTSWALQQGSRTLRAEIDMPNADGKLRPGTYVYARITGRLPETWTLPTSAVVKQGEAMVCFLIEDGKAVRTQVQVGHNDGQRVQVLKKQKQGASGWEDLTESDQVASVAANVTQGQQVQRVASEK